MCLRLMSAKRDSEIISSLRTAKEYTLIRASKRGLKNHSFHTHCLTINDSLDVIVQLCYSSSRMNVSIQLLSCHTNKPVD